MPAPKDFDWRQAKNGTLLLYWQGRQVKTMAGKEAAALAAKLARAGEEERQMLLAKATGNFKRGNERNTAGRRAEKEGE